MKKSATERREEARRIAEELEESFLALHRKWLALINAESWARICGPEEALESMRMLRDAQRELNAEVRTMLEVYADTADGSLADALTPYVIDTEAP